ncbi:hypothetical protein E2C01_041190 [Portunus trituberculatus]|uniref:Uncharacterized protein n=1 Tax=Portunus trituberculatus TaxID=210409 RepID=A0A5B7FR11_PORTR|nr:hypothetical protein [Portunus trituberculatus]
MSLPLGLPFLPFTSRPSQESRSASEDSRTPWNRTTSILEARTGQGERALLHLSTFSGRHRGIAHVPALECCCSGLVFV